MHPARLILALLLAVLIACPADDIAGAAADFAELTEGDEGELAEACPATLDPEAPLACEVLDCELDDAARLTCSVAWQLAPGHAGEFGIAVTGEGELAWDTEPLDAEAGAWERGDLLGPAEGTTCERISVNTDTVEASPAGLREVVVICVDQTAGLFSTDRVEIE